MICSLVLMSHYVSVKLPWINESKKRITNLVSKATEIKQSYYLCYYLTLLYLLYIICRCISDEYVFVGKASWLDLDPLILFLHRSGQSLISPDRNFFRSACGNSRSKACENCSERHGCSSWSSVSQLQWCPLELCCCICVRHLILSAACIDRAKSSIMLRMRRGANCSWIGPGIPLSSQIFSGKYHRYNV